MLDPDPPAVPTPPEAVLGKMAGIQERAQDLLSLLRAEVLGEAPRKTVPRRFSVGEAGELIGRTTQAIRDAEADGRLPVPAKSPTGRRVGYALEELATMRAAIGRPVGRGEGDPPIVLSVQNFKGGVGKSTTTIHLAHYLALHGYRVLVVDCDSQASTTSLFGLLPDLEVRETETIRAYLSDPESYPIEGLVRGTCWPGLDLIPANLSLYQAEYELAASAARSEGGLAVDRLARGVHRVAQGYDVVLLDSPPALGMVSISVLAACNALLIPVPPVLVDFSSTAQFLGMLREVADLLARQGLLQRYAWVRAVVTKATDAKSAHVRVEEMIRTVFGGEVLHATMRDSAEIDNAMSSMMSVYELEGPITSRETHKRCRAILDAVNGEIETLIRASWPSHRDRLRQEGKL